MPFQYMFAYVWTETETGDGGGYSLVAIRLHLQAIALQVLLGQVVIERLLSVRKLLPEM